MTAMISDKEWGVILQRHLDALEHLLERPAAGLTTDEEAAIKWAVKELEGLQSEWGLPRREDADERREIADAQGH